MKADGWHKKGFTLIELLVVIAIIALLLAIIMPSLHMAKKLAQNVVCKSNLNQLGIALETYETTYDNKRFVIRGGAVWSDGYWMGQLAPFLADDHYLANLADGKEAEVVDCMICPSAPVTRYKRDNTRWNGSGYWGTFNRPWEWKRANGSTLGSYGINGWIVYDIGYENNPGFAPYFYKNWLAVRPEVPVFGDAIWPVGWPRETDDPPVDLKGTIYASASQVNGDLDSVHEMRRFCIARHKKQINIIYKDMHVESTALDSLWNYKWNRRFKAIRDVDLPSE